jgi:hypothetical protein
MMSFDTENNEQKAKEFSDKFIERDKKMAG